MAEGGFDIEMVEFGREAERTTKDIDKDYKDLKILDKPGIAETKLDERFSALSLPKKSTDPLINLKVEIREIEVNKYYKWLEKEYGLKPDKGYIDYTNFEIEDNKLCLKVGEVADYKLVPLTYGKGGTSYYSLDTLAGKIRELNGGTKISGTGTIKKNLNLPDYTSRTKKIVSKEAAAKLKNLEENLPDVDTTELNDLPGATETFRKSIETTFPVSEGTQTIWTEREIKGIEKAMTDIRDEMTNNLAKLSSVDKDIEKEKRKLNEAKGDNDEYQVNRISNRIKDLESERSARMEVINNNREQLRSQVNRIRETIHKVLNEDTSLRERIRTLFKEQGITIVSILTAIGMTIGVIIEAVIPRGAGGVTPTPKPPAGGESVKDWIKKQLSNLGKLLAKLAGKAAEALPGVIGAIVSWLLNATAGVINWFGGNLWALLVLVIGLLFAAAKEYISRSRR